MDKSADKKHKLLFKIYCIKHKNSIFYIRNNCIFYGIYLLLGCSVKHGRAAQGAKKINLAGDFNSWSSTDTPLKQGKDGSFSVTVELPVDHEFQFRYLLDGCRWENDWKADKYIPAPFSNADNSVVVTSK